jgi:signal transduction histidine kinase
VYRLVQEALTNVLRHASHPLGVHVAVRYSPTAVDLVVTDDGAVVVSEPRPDGNGLVGMRERVALYGGTVESGPRAGGGWAVEARLTHEPPAEPPAPPEASPAASPAASPKASPAASPAERTARG